MNNKYALITGSTAGIGLDIAKELARLGHNIVLTARREDRLKEIAGQLSEEFNIHCDYVVADLADNSAPETIFNFCSSHNYAVEILVNNAGYSINKKFHETAALITMLLKYWLTMLVTASIKNFMKLEKRRKKSS